MAETATTETEETPAGTEESAQTPDSGDSPKLLTQEEVDAVVETRLARERKKYADYSDLKAKANKFDEFETKNLSELEKAQKTAEDLQKALEGTQSRVIKSTIKAEVASSNKISDTGLAVTLLTGSDKDLLTLDEEGIPTDMDATMDALLAKYPILAGSTTPAPTPSADQGARGGSKGTQLTQADLDKMTPQEIVTAHDEGRLATLTGG